MKKYRCPYCGREAFHLLMKLGLNTKFDTALRCSFCQKVSFRNFIIGGHFLYSAILGLSAILTACGVFISVKSEFNIGTLLFPIAFIAFYLLYNYYFCYFDRVKKECSDEILYLQLKELKNSWPDIRKGEIYLIRPFRPRDFASARDGVVVAQLETKKQERLKLRVIVKPPEEHFELSDEIAIYCGDTYIATAICAETSIGLRKSAVQKRKDDIK